jgi:hypothetical protein
MQNYTFTSFLYGHETSSLTLREKHRLRILKKRVLWRIFGPKREKMAGRRLHNEELHNLYISSNIRVIKSRRMGCVAHMGDMRNAYTILDIKSEGERPLKDLDIDEKVVLEWILGK